MNNSTLKKSANYFRCVGALYETSLKLEDIEIKLKDKEGNEAGKTTGQRIMGNIVVSLANGVHTFNVYFQNINSRLDENGNMVESRQWPMALSMLDWNPKLNGNSNEPVTMVNIQGTVSINDYVNRQGKVSSTLRWTVGKASTSVADDAKRGATLDITAYVGNIKPEIVKEVETGRLKVTLYAVDGNGACFPINCLVSKDNAEGFEEVYSVGDTASFTIVVNSYHVGKRGKRAFGGEAEVAVNTGYDVTELIIVGADDVIEEPDEDIVDEDGNPVEDKSGYINPKAMKIAIKIRAEKLAELEKNPPVRKTVFPKSSLRDKKEQSRKAKATPAPKINDTPWDDEDNIFDDLDDDI